MNELEINDDGSLKGTSFSETFNNVKVEYPSPKDGETYERYRLRVDKLVESEGFHLGDLGWDDWQLYCMGSGNYAGVDSNGIIRRYS